MIELYSGTPGSGKSLKSAQDLINKLIIRRQNVITNMQVDFDYVRTSKIKKFLNKIFKNKLFKNNYLRSGRLYHLENRFLTPDFLYKYANKFHKKGVESQTLIIIDECQMLFAPNIVKLKNQEDKMYRYKWLEFFTQHRKLGFNIILITQFDRLIDPQIRCLIEYNNIHRKINNFGLGWILSVFKISLFVQVQYWYGIRKKTGHSFFFYKKSLGKVYDSYKFHS